MKPSGEIMSKIQHLTDNNFHKSIGKGLALIDFFAVWCGPCRMLTPILEELADKYDGKEVLIGKIDIDTDQKIAAEYQVSSVPTLILFKETDVLSRSGACCMSQTAKC